MPVHGKAIASLNIQKLINSIQEPLPDDDLIKRKIGVATSNRSVLYTKDVCSSAYTASSALGQTGKQ